MDYDNWKLEIPKEKCKCCRYCGEASEKEFCNLECKKAYESD